MPAEFVRKLLRDCEPLRRENVERWVDPASNSIEEPGWQKLFYRESGLHPESEILPLHAWLRPDDLGAALAAVQRAYARNHAGLTVSFMTKMPHHVDGFWPVRLILISRNKPGLQAAATRWDSQTTAKDLREDLRPVRDGSQTRVVVLNQKQNSRKRD